MTTTRFEISHQILSSAHSMRCAHSHSYFELYYLVNGECNLFIHDNTYRMAGGTLAFIPANTLHKTTYPADRSHERLYIEFTMDYLADIIESIGIRKIKDRLYRRFFTIPREYQAQVAQILQILIREKNSPTMFSECTIKIYFQELLLLMLRHFDDALEEATHFENNNVQIIDESIQKAMLYIMENYTSHIMLEDVANQLHLNPSYFSKKFKSVNGFGFKEYLNTLRINHSEQLLLETDLSITDIAFQCGYENSNYFGDAFKHLNHTSPTTFRKLKGDVNES